MFLAERGSYLINTRRLRQLRRELGLSQAQLASLAGYSDRLIRKAELVGRLSGGAINDIVQALKERGAMITVHDLMLDSACVCDRFMALYQQHAAAAPDHCPDLFADDFVLRAAGNEHHPLAGQFAGVSGFQRWLQLFFGIFTRQSGHCLSPRSFREGDEILVCFSEQLTIGASLWINWHFVIRDGLIASLFCQYDTEAVLTLYKRSLYGNADEEETEPKCVNGC